ncbi:MAG: hypothetical protein ABIJ12_11110 [bacterium]
MLKKTIILIILSFLIFAPIIGEVLPLIEIFFPLGGAFHVPWDAPPFMESFLPMFGIFSMGIGGIGLLLYFITRGKKIGGVRAYSYVMIVYSILGFIIWFYYFFVRFLGAIPILYNDFSFYYFWIAMTLPHCIWFFFLRYTLKTIKNVPLIESDDDIKEIIENPID